QRGRAEETGLPAAAADVVLAAQSFHWFEPSAALAEFHRVLKPGGMLALVWNERDESDACTAAYGDVIRTAPDAKLMEHGRQSAGEVLGRSPLFTDVETLVLAHRQQLDRHGLFGRAMSVSYAPRDAAAIDSWRATLDAVFDHYQQAGLVTLLYQTT